MTIKSGLVALALAAAASAQAFEACPYAEASLGAFFPQGASRFGSSSAVSVRLGSTLADAWAAEAECGALPETGNASLAVRSLWRFSGYERLDPFLSCGWAAVLSRDTGPEFGFGAWYYLSNRWQLRGDARAVPFVGDGCRVAFFLSFGVGFAF